MVKTYYSFDIFYHSFPTITDVKIKSSFQNVKKRKFEKKPKTRKKEKIKLNFPKSTNRKVEQTRRTRDKTTEKER